VGNRVVVAVLEQNYDATQKIPAYRSEQAALSTYGELEGRMVALADWLRDRGWRARPETFVGESMFIAYAVAAGLGELGLNGQAKINTRRCLPVLFQSSGCSVCMKVCPVQHYGPGEKPHVPNSVVQPPSYQFDPARTEPLSYST
jgi:hypothetical protein